MVVEASTFIGPLKALLSMFQKERHYNDAKYIAAEEKRKIALQSMYAAYIETKKYIESGSSDRNKELDLSQLWAEAAIKSRGYTDVMVSANSTKAKYYANQFKWSKEEIREKGIDLETIEKRLLELVNEA